MDTNNNKIGYYLERTTRLVKLNFHQEFKNVGLSLTPEQWVIIDLLTQENGLSQSDLAEQSFKDAPSISRIIDVLVKKNYVERNPSKEDRRKFEIFLTQEGRALEQQVRPVVSELRAKSWQGLTKEDYDSFIKIINRIFKNMEQ